MNRKSAISVDMPSYFSIRGIPSIKLNTTLNRKQSKKTFPDKMHGKVNFKWKVKAKIILII